MDDEQKQTETIDKETYLRLAADFENYRKRMESERGEMAKFAGQAVLTEMLTLADMVEQAVVHAPDAVKADAAWFGGLEKVAQRFTDDMAKFGLARIVTVGKPFDPATMEAVSAVSGGESHTVKEEIRAGYTMHDRVIRPARVVVYE